MWLPLERLQRPGETALGRLGWRSGTEPHAEKLMGVGRERQPALA